MAISTSCASIRDLLPDLIAVGADERGVSYLAHHSVERVITLDDKEVRLKMYSTGPARGMLSLRGIKEGMTPFKPFKPKKLEVQAFLECPLYKTLSEYVGIYWDTSGPLHFGVPEFSINSYIST